MSREDPKPGRWLLPLVVAGIIGFTYTFVNALPAAEVVSPTTSTSAAAATSTTTTSTSSTTTTTLPPETVAFLGVVDDLDAAAADLADRAQRLNEEWDARTTGFSATRDGLSALRGETDDYVDSLTATSVPEDAADAWVEVLAAGEAMATAADDMLDGLVNSAGSERRLAALDDYQVAEASVRQALDDAADDARG